MIDSRLSIVLCRTYGVSFGRRFGYVGLATLIIVELLVVNLIRVITCRSREGISEDLMALVIVI